VRSTTTTTTTTKKREGEREKEGERKREGGEGKKERERGRERENHSQHHRIPGFHPDVLRVMNSTALHHFNGEQYTKINHLLINQYFITGERTRSETRNKKLNN